MFKVFLLSLRHSLPAFLLICDEFCPHPLLTLSPFSNPLYSFTRMQQFSRCHNFCRTQLINQWSWRVTIFFPWHDLEIKINFYFVSLKTKNKQNKPIIGFTHWARILARHTERKEKGTSFHQVNTAFAVLWLCYLFSTRLCKIGITLLIT